MSSRAFGRKHGPMDVTRGTSDSLSLPIQITKLASKQAYCTIRFLVDCDRVASAFRAYSYFRWVDDCLDEALPDTHDRLAFVKRQRAILRSCYQGAQPGDLSPEEQLLADLVETDGDPCSGLYAYLGNMMAVMAFDANRRGCVVSQRELDEYSRWLATAVTEALHYFIGHDSPTPHGPTRYLAATAAHISHMLRDTAEDVEAGYFNIPCEFLQAYRINPCDLESEAYRVWTRARVGLARDYFRAGRRYLARVKDFRCRLAGYAYIARFSGVLNAMERDGYRLRADYRDCANFVTAVHMSGSVLFPALGKIRLNHALRAAIAGLSRSSTR